MLDAICTFSEGTEKVVSIFEFKVLPEKEIDKLRYSLLCPVCKKKAYFRKASRDGKQACFGSRYHAPSCAEFNHSAGHKEEQNDALEIEAIVLEEGALKIDFDAPVLHINKKQTRSTANINRRLPRSTSATLQPKDAALGTSEQHATLKKQGLKKLLTSLLRGSSLANSDLWVYTSEKHKWRAKNLFVNVNQAQATDNGAPRMYWGTLSHADKSLNWLNPREERSVAIPIGQYKEVLLARFDITEARELEGAGFIIFAKCVQSKDKKRQFLQLWGNDVQHFYIAKLDE